MPIMTEELYKRMRRELSDRFYALDVAFNSRSLVSEYEGCNKGSKWADPNKMVATKGSLYELKLAVDDFKTILSTIRSLK